MSEDIYKYDNGEPIFSEDIKKLNDEQQKEAELQFEKRIMDFKDTFSTPEGTRVLFFLMHEMYFCRDYGQSNANAYKFEGKREISNQIVDMVGLEYILERLITAKKLHTREKSDG